MQAKQSHWGIYKMLNDGRDELSQEKFPITNL